MCIFHVLCTVCRQTSALIDKLTDYTLYFILDAKNIFDSTTRIVNVTSVQYQLSS